MSQTERGGEHMRCGLCRGSGTITETQVCEHIIRRAVAHCPECGADHEIAVEYECGTEREVDVVCDQCDGLGKAEDEDDDESGLSEPTAGGVEEDHR
jgi:DNA replicative helicase MCM subunit Mcm2 (Cdc46/Mcm family)